MTNATIIANEAIMNEIYTKEEIETMLANGYAIPLHTYKKWQTLGYQVQKGEKAAVKTKLWKPVKTKAETDEEKEEMKMILVNAALFTIDQVKPIQ